MTMPISISSRASSPVFKIDEYSMTPSRALSSLSLSFCSDPAEIADQWLAFEKRADTTVFQSYKWASTWCRTSAMAYGERPLIVAGYDAADQLALILPMAILQKLGTCVLSWLCQERSNYSFGLYRRDIIDQIGEAEIRAIIAQIARHRPEISAIDFRKQPFEWNGFKNPLAHLPSHPATCCTYALNLSSDFESFYASNLSAHRRRLLSRKERKLAKAGDLKITNAETEAERLEVLETFLTQKAVKLHSQNESNVFADPRLQQFYRELARETQDGAPSEYSSLAVGDTVAATCHGTLFQDRFYFLTTSMDLGELAKCSPGAILLRHQIAQHCRRGTAVFDFGPGEEPYKAAWNVYDLPLFETYLSLSPRGWATTFLSQTKARSKWGIKNNSILWKMGSSVRALFKAVRRSITSGPNGR